MKLKTITFDKAPKIAGVRPGELGEINCENPTVPLRGWRAVIKGAQFALVSPPGWKSSGTPREWDKQGPVTVWEMPRSQCFLQWLADSETTTPDTIMATLAKGFISEPFGKPFDASELEGPPAPKPLNPAEMGDA